MFPELDRVQVAQLAEAPDGIMWFAIEQGDNLLMRYDGYQWNTYPPPKASYLGRIRCLLAEKEEVYIGGSNGLLRFREGQWTHLLPKQPHFSHNYNINTLTKTSDGTLLVATDLGLFVVKGDHLHVLSIPPIINNIILPDQNCSIQVLDDSSLFRKHKKFKVNTILPVTVDSFLMCVSADKQQSWGLHIEPGKQNPFRISPSPLDMSDPAFGLQTFAQISHNQDIWICSASAYRNVSKFDGTSWQQFSLPNMLGGTNEHYSLVEMDDHSLLIGGAGYIYTYRQGKWDLFHSPQLPLYSSASVLLEKTKDGNLWVLSKNNKVHYVEYNDQHWKTFDRLLFQCEEDDGTQWFLSPEGFAVVHKAGKWAYYDPSDGLMDAPVRLFLSKEGEVWSIGGHQNEACIALLEDGKWVKQLFPGIAKSFDRRSVYQDPDGNIWLGSAKQLSFRKKHQGGIVCISADRSDSLKWIYGPTPKIIRGGFAMTPKGNLVAFSTHRTYKAKNFYDWHPLKTNLSPINKSFREADGTLWLASQERGLHYLTKDQFISYNLDGGLLSNTVKDVCRANNRIWILTGRDIASFNGERWINQVLPDEFIASKEAGELNADRSGNLWISKVFPDWTNRLSMNKAPSDSLEFYSVRYLPDTIPPQVSIDFFQVEVNATGNTMLNWKGKDYMNINAPSELEYAYRLDQGEWSDFTSTTSQPFFSLPGGTHTLEVKAIDKDFNESIRPAQVAFTVALPVWKQAWFVLLIIGLLGIIAYFLYASWHRNNELFRLNRDLSSANQQLQIHQEEIIRQKEEVHQAKLAFFTNISHEFRTPLSLIKGPLDRLIQNQSPTLLQRYLPILKRNTDLLLRLVDEIMTFRKLEFGHLPLTPQATEMVGFCREIAAYFEDQANLHDIEYRFTSDVDALEAWIDQLKCEKICRNLLSNAFKFTPQGGKITFMLCAHAPPANPRLTHEVQVLSNPSQLDPGFEIVIEDNGSGIAEAVISQIFDRFFQENERTHRMGSGIGLALTRELVQLHEGELVVHSTEGIGTRFTVRLPLRSPAKAPSHSTETTAKHPTLQAEHVPKINYQPSQLGAPTLAPSATSATLAQTLLIIEDQPDMREFLATELGNHYRILTAPDGKEGVALALAEIPDLVISDVMMPIMDGIAVCNTLKSDKRTSHIPIILLTARTSQAFQLEGLQTGADLYVLKPFDLDILRSQIQTLFFNRQKVIEYLRSKPITTLENTTTNPADQTFLQELNTLIQAKLSDPRFNVERLSKEIGMSKRNLQLKLKALTGRTPHQLIREARLNKALALLKSNNHTASEIAYLSGFSDPAYFHRVFKQHYQLTPKQFVMQGNSPHS